jgi:uncharacterized protein YehS (DUF1456 family)
MTQNDILRRLRYALDIPDGVMLEIFRLSNHEIDQTTLRNLLKKEDDPAWLECSEELLGLFLDGMIIQKRGPREGVDGSAVKSAAALTNNDILKKVRIALELREDELIAIMGLAKVSISKSELSALFRSRGQKNYKTCGDQFLRQFLQGLAIRSRGTVGVEG